MPVRSLPLTDDAPRILLEGIVDYAGLFPPASVSMQVAARNFAHYRASGNGWMLGRFVCPANALEQFSTLADPLLPRDAGAIPWRISAIGSGDATNDLAAISAFNERHVICFDDRGAVVDSYETKAATVDAIEQIAATIPHGTDTYIELPLDGFDGDLDAPLRALARSGRRAKMRMGGVTAEAFPTPASVIAFLEGCLRHGVVAKATAGLHHPMCGSYRLTYEPDAPTGRMFGYANLFLAAALLTSGASANEATMLLQESDPSTLEANDLHIAWKGPETLHVFDRALLQRVRQTVLVSFGSCSFTEPVDEARSVGLLR